jgi:hypothetical protein
MLFSDDALNEEADREEEGPAAVGRTSQNYEGDTGTVATTLEPST